MTKNNSKDLTVGSPTGLILGFSLPLLLGMLFQQVYSLDVYKRQNLMCDTLSPTLYERPPVVLALANDF